MSFAGDDCGGMHGGKLGISMGLLFFCNVHRAALSSFSFQYSFQYSSCSKHVASQLLCKCVDKLHSSHSTFTYFLRLLKGI